MKPYIFLVCLALLSGVSLTAGAQQKKGSVNALILDSATNQPIDYASFAVKAVKDTSVAAIGVTKADGLVSIKNLPLGQYKFYAAYIGYRPLIKAFELTAEKPEVDFGKIILAEAAYEIGGVDVKADLLPMIIKKDTIEFNADAFKTQQDATAEDMLKVVPGMEVAQDGSILFNGKKIDRVLVDGKEFFGNDIKMATQNLPREIIDKVQVIEKKTDDAIFKGVDNGVRENVVNFSLKKDKKKGYFGNAAIGKGTSDLYESAININRFSGSRQFTVIASSNNVGRSTSDFNVQGGGGFAAPMVVSMGGFGGGGGAISTVKNLGTNFNDEWGKDPKRKNKIFFNYNLGNSNTLTQGITSRLNLLGQNSFYNDRSSVGNSSNTRHQLNSRLEMYLDTNTRLQVRPSFSYNNSSSLNTATFNSYKEISRDPINNGNSSNFSDRSTPNYNGSVTLNRRFGNKGRSLSIGANMNSSATILDGLNKSLTIIDNSGAPTSEIIDQLIDQSTNAKGYGFNFDYNEPVTEKFDISTAYNFNRREDIVKRFQYDYNTGTAQYDIINNDLSRSLENFNATHSVELGFNFNPSEKFNFSINLDEEFVRLFNFDHVKTLTVDKNFILFQPNLRFTYKMNKTSSLSFNASRWTQTPDASQLQPVTNNDNPLYLVTGNASLRPSSSNNLNFNYNTFNPTTNIGFNASSGFNYYQDQIMNNTFYDIAKGGQSTTYGNVSGSYNFNVRLGGNFKVKSLGLSFNPNLSASISKSFSFFDGYIVHSRSRNLTVGMSTNYTVGQALQFFNWFNANIRRMSYSYNSLPDNRFLMINNSMSLTTTLPYDFRFGLNSSVTFNGNAGISGNTAPQHIAGASFEKLFMKKNMSLKASISDIFNNVKSVNRSISDTYIIDSVNQGMQRYFLMSMTYRLRKFGT